MMVVRPKHVGALFNVNFNVSFNIILEQFNCAFSWIDKGLDNIKLHGTNVKMEYVLSVMSLPTCS
jgi:hypothetical protein